MANNSHANLFLAQVNSIDRNNKIILDVMNREVSDKTEHAAQGRSGAAELQMFVSWTKLVGGAHKL